MDGAYALARGWVVRAARRAAVRIEGSILQIIFGVYLCFFATVSAAPGRCGEGKVNSEQVCKSSSSDNTGAMRAQANNCSETPTTPMPHMPRLFRTRPKRPTNVLIAQHVSQKRQRKKIQSTRTVAGTRPAQRRRTSKATSPRREWRRGEALRTPSTPSPRQQQRGKRKLKNTSSSD